MRLLVWMLGLVVLVALAVILGWGSLETDGPELEPALDPASKSSSGPLEGSPDPRSELATVGGAQDGRIVAGDSGQATRRQTITGHVVLDPDCPQDEVIELIASASGGHDDWRIEIQQDRSFQATFPYGSHSCAIRVAGRYHFGRTAFDPHRQQGVLILKPVLGGLVRVQLDRSDPDLIPDKIGARHDDGYVPGVALGEGIYEIPGLDPLVKFNVFAEFASWVNPVQRGVRVRAGQITDITLTVAAGARITGRVLDESGNPIPGATLTAVSRLGRGNLGPFAGEAKTEATDDGLFDLRGIHAGWTTLSISAKEFVRRRVDLDVMEEGQVVTDKEYVLEARSGGIVSGTVHWPDGQPASDGRVRCTSNEPSVTLMSFVRLDGSFQVEGLPEGVVDVIAESLGDEVHAAGRATLTAVPVGSKEVALVLGPTDHLLGMVVDDRGVPVSDFMVEAHVIEGGGTNFSVESASTSQEGAFDLDGLFDGIWSIQAEADGHAASTLQFVSMPSTSGGLVLRCPRSASIEGHVTASSGEPIQGARVEVLSAEGKSVDTKSDASGAFAMSDLAIGPVTVKATLDGHAPSTVLHLDLAAGDQRENIALALRTGATLTGEMHASIANPGSRNVIATRVESFESVKIDVDADGKFERSGIRPGRYFVARDWMGGDDWVLNYSSRLEVEVELTEGGTTHVVLGKDQPGVVQVVGTVRENGKCASGYTVYVFGTVRGERQMPISISRTNELGIFEVTVTSAGDYRFSIGEQQVAQTVFQRHVAEGSRVELSFDMPTGIVKGRVLQAGGAPSAKHSISLTLQDAPSETREFGELRLVQTDSSGDFEATNLAPGRYRLRATGSGSSFGKPGHAHEVQRDIIVLDGETTEVLVQLQHQAILEGTLLDADGHPAPGIRIAAFDANGEPHRVWTDEFTDANGNFRLLGVPSGTITVRATTHDGLEATVEVQALAGETHWVELQLP